MLDKAAGCNAESNLARESLYVKFDPLVEGSKSPAPAKSPLLARVAPITRNTVSESNDLLLIGTPTDSQTTHSAKKTGKETNKDKHSLKPKSCDLDLLNISLPPSQMTVSDHENRTVEPTTVNGIDIVQVLKFSQADVNRMKAENEMEFQARIKEYEKEHQKKIEALAQEKQASILKNENLRKENEDMKIIVEQFETTLSQVIAEKDSCHETVNELNKERDQLTEELHSVETAFSDLHRRYEKMRSAIEGFQKNEDTLKKCVIDLQSKIKTQDQKYQSLKQHAENKMVEASNEIEKVKKNNQSELTRLQAGLRKAEVQIQSLEQTVAQKTKENQELTSICDELLKVNK